MKTLVVLLGPTAVGKTELSLKLAEHLKSPIISADSRQLYSELKIGTAAPTPEQLARVKHYFIGTLHLIDYYSAAQYEQDALSEMERLFQEHDKLLMTGGSMMYIDAVIKGIDDIPTVDEETRQMVKEHFEKDGLDVLAAELKMLDPEYYQIVDLKNHKRVVHALEICYMTGKTFTSFRKAEIKKRPFKILLIGLQRPREELFRRIGLRVDQMMADGLLEEVKSVQLYRELNALNTVGYKEILKYLDGEWPLDMAVEKIKRNTRIYAKKQMTWFKKNENIKWFNPDDSEAIIEYIDNN
ncbi:MAG: tRNA (adenosine(37)-N6)-dimethylallyltransferase MiaA [Bacteroidaceae bacterium]|nr:tRNA (adenosine(37)-N6)-dimethylallyltransferase MiaA [Bacteroidaceae bacterium]